MGKIFLGIILAISVIIVSKPLRERVQPHVQFLFDPFYEWSTQNQVRDIQNELQAHLALGRPFPEKRTFSDHLKRLNKGADASVDPWGTPYYLEGSRRSFRVGSAGPDRIPKTADDILSTPSGGSGRR